MLRAALLRAQIRLYAVQSLAVSVLAVVVAAGRGIPELYVLAGMSLALKVVIVPLVVLHLLRDDRHRDRRQRRAGGGQRGDRVDPGRRVRDLHRRRVRGCSPTCCRPPR